MYEYEKKIIGRLVGFYRKKKSKKNEFYTRDLFIKTKSSLVREMCKTCNKACANREEICSSKTRLLIEKGEPVKNICFYIDFCEKLDRQYILNKRLVDIVQYSEKKLNLFIRTNHKQEIEGFKRFLLNTLEQYKDVMYFSEMIQLYLAIVDMILFFSFPDASFIEVYEINYPYFNDNTKFLIAYLLIHYYEIYDYQTDKLNYYIDEMSKLPVKNIKAILYQHKKQLSSLDFYHYLINLDDQQFTSFEHFTKQLYFVDVAFQLKHYRLALNTLDQCIEESQSVSESITPYPFFTAIQKKATILYHLKRYNEALTLFKQVYQFNIDLLSYDFMVFIHCIELCNQLKIINRYLNVEDYNTIKVPKVKRIYRYYQQKYIKKYSYRELEDFILHELRYYIPNNTIYYDIMSKDMMEYCTATKDYKSFFLFQKQIQHK